MRQDLFALTPEVVAALANLGLVKRAQRELAAGQCPALTEDDRGLVTGTFADGTITRLPPDVSLRDALCSCAALATCRHKVTVALAYRDWAAAQQDTRPPETIAWSPGNVTDEALSARLGKRALDRAQTLRRTGVVVEVRPPSKLDPVASARLPSCTVRFLVARDLAYAQCDCLLKHDCEHVAVAVWAFRTAGERTDPTIVEVVLQPATGATTDDALAASVALARDVLLDGAVNASAALAQRFAIVSSRLASQGYTWPLGATTELEELLAAYRARSTRYRAVRLAEVLAEIVARPRAAARSQALPTRAVLGQDEPAETRLDLLRLVSLGARVVADGRDREAEVLLADPDTAIVLSLRKRWQFAEGEELPTAPALGRRRMTGSVLLSALAKGQVVTRAARRSADRRVVLGEGRGGLTSITPHPGDYANLPTPIRVDRIAQLETLWTSRAPRLLRPRVLAEDVHVLPVAEVANVNFSPGAQRLTATLFDEAHDALELVLPYRALAPDAHEYLAAALEGVYGPVRWISGEVRRQAGHFEIEPLAIVCDRVIVPDLEQEPIRHALPKSEQPDSPDPLAAALERALGLLEGSAHHGLRYGAATLAEQLHAGAELLRQTGLSETAATLDHFGAQVRAARADSTNLAWEAAADAWCDAAIRTQLAKEQM